MLNIRKRMGEEGLTLIELLITIAVIAVVAAISIPVITNVISSSETNAAASMDAQVDSFLDKYTQSGEVTFDGTDTFTAWVDLNGDGTFDNPAEVIETFTVDTTQFAVTVDSNTAPTSAGTSVAAEGASSSVASSAFQTASTPSDWGSLTGPTAGGTTNDYCGAFLTWSGRGTTITDWNSVSDWTADANTWSYSVDGGAFTPWLSSWSGGKIYGGASPGDIMLPAEDWITGETGLCSLSAGQQVQFLTPDGYYTEIITITAS